jgi:uncharacterized protein YaaN involved in tellurite resistance
MIVDATITVGNIIEIATIAAGGLIAIVTVKNSVNNLKSDLHNMKSDFTDMKSEIKKVGEVLVQLAITGQRLTNAEQDIRELKHGRGFVLRESGQEYP